MRNAIGLLLRLYSYLFHTILSVFLIGIGLIAVSAGKELKLGMLPWEGPMLNQWIIVLGVVGLLSVLLAITGLLRFLFPIWALLIAVLMFRGFFLSSFNFEDASQFKGAIALTIGAVGAFLSSLSLYTLRRRRRST